MGATEELRPGAVSRTVNPRAAAARVLTEVLVDGRSLTEALAAEQGADKALIQELCFGVLRWYARLDALAGALLNKPLRGKDRDIRLLILIGLYQLDFTRVAPHAALSETVAAARVLGKSWATGLINGVLRQYQRRRAELQALTEDSEAARMAFPEWLLERLRRAWPAHWRDIADASNQRPPMSLRVNARRDTRDAYLARLGAAGIPAHAHELLPQAVVLERAMPVDRLPGFSQGEVSVQDAGAQLAARLLAPGRGHRVLDACAAPGGKSCHILESTPEIAGLTAVDIDEGRLERLRGNLDRLGLEARIRVGDAAAPDGDWARSGYYERILLDVPCSATGVIRRHPDIKWLRRAQDIEALVILQAKMLNAVWPLLAPGGRLLYSTCSLIPEENDCQVQAFLRRARDARERPLGLDWGHARSVGRQTLPGEGEMDGFYYACLEKT